MDKITISKINQTSGWIEDKTATIEKLQKLKEFKARIIVKPDPGRGSNGATSEEIIDIDVVNEAINTMIRELKIEIDLLKTKLKQEMISAIK